MIVDHQGEALMIEVQEGDMMIEDLQEVGGSMIGVHLGVMMTEEVVALEETDMMTEAYQEIGMMTEVRQGIAMMTEAHQGIGMMTDEAIMIEVVEVTTDMMIVDHQEIDMMIEVPRGIGMMTEAHKGTDMMIEVIS